MGFQSLRLSLHYCRREGGVLLKGPSLGWLANRMDLP
jgi:hypothetical protein